MSTNCPARCCILPVLEQVGATPNHCGAPLTLMPVAVLALVAVPDVLFALGIGDEDDLAAAGMHRSDAGGVELAGELTSAVLRAGEDHRAPRC